jgi:hypothetical protein
VGGGDSLETISSTSSYNNLFIYLSKRKRREVKLALKDYLHKETGMMERSGVYTGSARRNKQSF